MNPSQFTLQQTAFIMDRVRAAKNEILRVWVLGETFAMHGKRTGMVDIKEYSDLHDYCDANEFGGWCYEHGTVAATIKFLFPAEEQAPGPSFNHWLDGANAMQEHVNAWITCGDMHTDGAFLSWRLDVEQAECLLDEDRWLEAYGMIDDMESRVGWPKADCDRLRTFLRAKPQWLREFPSFGDGSSEAQTVMDTMPPEWDDTSWHNDAHPSFERTVGEWVYRLWVVDGIRGDVGNSVEQTGHLSFSLYKYPAASFPGDANNAGHTFDTDDWMEMLGFMEKVATEPDLLDKPQPPAAPKFDAHGEALEKVFHTTSLLLDDLRTLMELSPTKDQRDALKLTHSGLLDLQSVMHSYARYPNAEVPDLG